MDYFKSLLRLLKMEKEADKIQSLEMGAKLSLQYKREMGLTWYPVAIKETETTLGDYWAVEVERTSNLDIVHQFRFGVSVALFSNTDLKNNRIEGVITSLVGNQMKITLRVDELPEWIKGGKLGVDLVFDDYSYREMEAALVKADKVLQENGDNRLIKIMLGLQKPSFSNTFQSSLETSLNENQNDAVKKSVSSQDICIIHGPPGTGKTTTLVAAISTLLMQDDNQILVTAPSNAAVDLLTERLHNRGLKVTRIGNPARINDRLLSLTLEGQMAAHPQLKEIKRLKKQAVEYRTLATKYKRSFGPEEREQRKSLLAEARNLNKEVARIEDYITSDILSRSNIITCTLVGANHYSIKDLKFKTVVVDEAGQALEPAMWIPILKAEKVIMAGDHCQLPPTIKSEEVEKQGLGKTLLEKCVEKAPEAVILLEEQYRMNEKIMKFPSVEFYENRLKADISVAEQVLFEGDHPFEFIDTAGCGFEESKEESQISNKEEAAFLLKHLKNYLNNFSIEKVQLPSVGIIAPYKHQTELLKELFRIDGQFSIASNDITINTIDSFQGQERDIIYISLTRSNADKNIGFLSEIRRTNVAMTRARKKLVIIGDSSTLSQFAFYDDLINYSQKIDSYRSAWDFYDL